MKELEGLRAVVLESRLADTMASLARLRGAEVFSAPSMREVPLEDNREALEFGEALMSGGVDILILLTGVGAKALLEVLASRHDRALVLRALASVQLVPRGPKPLKVLREWGLQPALTVPEPNTWKELVAELDLQADRSPLSGKRVAVQEYGAETPELLEALRARGAKVTRVPVYRWALPEDTRPLQEAARRIAGGEADLVFFTTSAQVSHLFQVAADLGLEAKLREGFGRVVIASVGPECTKKLKDMGLRADIEPESPKMGPLVAAAARDARQMLSVLKTAQGGRG